ncbi:MAG: GntR family transcriptional regulator [Rhizobiaceae bacterium]
MTLRQDSARMTQFSKALLELRLLVLNGEFEAKSRLPETALAERLGISRTPLRQAMARLVEEGLLERLETGGCRVASFTMDDIIDAIEIRGVMEGTAARLAAERGPDPALAEECRRVLDDLDDAVFGAVEPDFSRYVPLNARFHQLVAEMSGSRLVRREVERAARLPLASPSAFLQGQALIPDFRASLRHAQVHHEAIFDAIVSREGTRAEALAREHARLARKNLDYVMNTDPSLAERVPGMALVSA